MSKERKITKKGHVPLRMCTGCRRRRKKEELVRLIKISEEVAIFDGKKILPGRGVYLCPDPACLRMARKKGRIGHVLGMNETWASSERRVSP